MRGEKSDEDVTDCWCFQTVCLKVVSITGNRLRHTRVGRAYSSRWEGLGPRTPASPFNHLTMTITTRYAALVLRCLHDTTAMHTQGAHSAALVFGTVSLSLRNHACPSGNVTTTTLVLNHSASELDRPSASVILSSFAQMIIATWYTHN